eukprot:5451323-Karenia_brevis.AAC.1
MKCNILVLSNFVSSPARPTKVGWGVGPEGFHEIVPPHPLHPQAFTDITGDPDKRGRECMGDEEM